MLLFGSISRHRNVLTVMTLNEIAYGVTAKVRPIDADEIAGAVLPLVPACVAERPQVPTASKFTV